MNRISPVQARGRGAWRKGSGERSAARRMVRETVVKGGVVTPPSRSGPPRPPGRIAETIAKTVAAPGRRD